jgi:hypothetical protein
MTDWLGHIGGVSSALAGLDMSMPGDGAIPLFGESYWAYELSRSVLNETIPVERLNDMVSLSCLPRSVAENASTGDQNRGNVVQIWAG